jgi:carboxyl-terminal processing protease
MKKTFQFSALLLLLAFVFQGCDEKNDNDVPNEIAVNNFVWKGLNLYYLWQADVPNLSDYRFENQSQLNNYLFSYSNPADLFEDLLNKPSSQFAPGEAIDRFSVIFSDYTQLEGILSGTTKNNGVDFALYYKDDTQTTIFGVVRYILPNSDAATKDILRGDIFYAIDGQTLTVNNYQTLLGRDNYTMNLANYDGGNITPNGDSVNLTRTILSENPVHIHTVINEGSHKIGYLMYNGFYPSYETQLNNAFGEFKSQGITDLVLDLRYNGGGSVETATHLASMITGQFPGQVFAKEQWNAKVEDFYATHNPANLYNLFATTINTNAAINSLNLTKVYILTSRATASASELVINGLEPYMNVVQIGDVTVGKNVGSVTLYDSPTFAKKDISSKHRYAMQPLVLKIVNKSGFGDYVNGLEPDDLLRENLGNLGTLGNRDEPLLNAAITRIVGGGRPNRIPAKIFNGVRDNRPLSALKNEMYLEKVPEGLLPQ